MKKMEAFTDIGQFRNVVKSVISQSSFQGYDENNEAIHDHTQPKPIVKFTGTVKSHGTNAGVCFNNKDGLWVQSRTNIITPETDNAGAAFNVMAIKTHWQKLIDEVIQRESVDANTHNICIFYEWCGKGIQKGVAISELPKMAIIFAVKIAPHDATKNSYYVRSNGLSDNTVNIFNVEQFGKYELDIDFSRPDVAQNKLVELTEQVEKECPIGKYFGVSGIGEGIVWNTEYKGTRHIFKTKGIKHSSSKVRTLAAVDTEKVDSIIEFVDYACSENRLKQGIEQVFTSKGIEMDITKTGDFLRWVVNDIIKEETDTMFNNNIEPKDANRYISTKARTWFINYINSELGIK